MQKANLVLQVFERMLVSGSFDKYSRFLGYLRAKVAAAAKKQPVKLYVNTTNRLQ